MKRPSRERPKPADQGNDPTPPEFPGITLGRDQIDENRLHPLGIPGINFLEPNLELVDYKDWFLQPIQGNIQEFGGIDITVSEDGCMVCVSARGSLGWLEASEGNGAGFCYIKPSCRKKEPNPDDDNLGFEPFTPPSIPNINVSAKPGDSVTIIQSFVMDTAFASPLCKGLPPWKRDYPPLQQVYINTYGIDEDTYITAGLSSWGGDNGVPYNYKCPGEERKAGRNGDTYFVGLVSNHWGINNKIISETRSHSGREWQLYTYTYLVRWDIEIKVNGEKVYPTSDDGNDREESPPPKPPENDKMDCCRNQTNSDKLLRKIAQCVGTQQLPATMPKSFNRKVSGTTRITSIPEFQQWMAIQFSDLIGEFPKKIKIKDANLLEDGDQGLEIELPNLSEAIADLYGTGVRATAVNEVLMAFATRMAVEICSIKSATLVGQSYSKATALALGYKFEEEKTVVPFGFNFDANAEKLEDFLEASEKKITTWACKEPSSAWEYFERLMYVAGLVKAKTLRKEASTLGDTIKRIKDLGLLGEDKIDDFMDKLKEAGFYNVDDSMRKPDVEKL